MVSGGITPTPTYDANGNQTSATPATLTWNALNQPITVNSTTATYDALGRMVEKGLGSTYTQFVYNPDGTNLAVYSGGLTKGTISLPGGSTAVYNASGLNFIRHKDWLGSSRLATTWAHAVYAKEAYAPFGETYNEAGTADRSFTGQDQNVVTNSGGTGVYDYLFRKYDPSAGRWMSPDPSGWNAAIAAYPQSLNRYSYVQDDPLRLVDQNGLACISVDINGNVSVDNDSLDSMAQGQCELDGGNFVAGNIDPDDVSVISVNGSIWNSDGTVDFGYGGNRMFFGAQIYSGWGFGNGYGDYTGSCLNSGLDCSPPSSAATPDFYSLNVGIGGIIGWNGTLTMDRYGDVFGSPAGAEVGKSPTIVSASFTANYMDNEINSQGEMNNMLSAWGGSAIVGYWVGATRSWTPGTGWATGGGIVTPQAGVSANYCWYIGNSGITW